MKLYVDRKRWRNPHTGRLESESSHATVLSLTAEKRKPTEADAPPLSTFPGRPVKPTPGQLDLFGGEVQG